MFKKIGFAGAALVLAATAAVAGEPLTQEDAVKILSQAGAWLEADGAFLPDGSITAKDLEVHPPGHGDTEEPAIYGAVSGLNRAKSTMRVLGYPVQWDETTTLKDDAKKVILSSKISDGMGVKVQGSLQPNGVFKATKIKLATMKNKNGKMEAKEKVFGPVKVVDPKRGIFQVLNTTVNLRENAAFVKALPQP